MGSGVRYVSKVFSRVRRLIAAGVEGGEFVFGVVVEVGSFS